MTEQDDVEQLADAVLDAVEEDLQLPGRDESSMPDAATTAGLAFRRLGIDFVRRYNRLEMEVEDSAMDNPCGAVLRRESRRTRRPVRPGRGARSCRTSRAHNAADAG